MKRPVLPIVVTATAALSVLPLGACGSSSSSSSSASTAVSATTAVSSPSASDASSSAAASATPGSSASTPTPTLPAGYKLVTVPEAKVRYGVPMAWLEVNAKALDAPAVRRIIAPMAKANGVSVDAMVKNMTSSSVLYMISPLEDGAGAHNNINAGHVIDSDDLSEGTDMTKQAITSEGAKVTGETTVQTALGAGTSTVYSLVMGGRTAHGVMLLLPTPAHKLVPVVVTAGTAPEAAGFAASVVKSYRAA